MNMMTNYIRVANNKEDKHGEKLWDDINHEITALRILYKSLLSDRKPSMPDCLNIVSTAGSSEGLNTLTVKCFRRRV